MQHGAFQSKKLPAKPHCWNVCCAAVEMSQSAVLKALAGITMTTAAMPDSAWKSLWQCIIQLSASSVHAFHWDDKPRGSIVDETEETYAPGFLVSKARIEYVLDQTWTVSLRNGEAGKSRLFAMSLSSSGHFALPSPVLPCAKTMPLLTLFLPNPGD